MHVSLSMPSNPRSPAHSYEDIVRQTVPEPDSSFRPTRAQERAAYEGARMLDEDERWLYVRVVDSLLAVSDLDPSGVRVEIDRDRVTLRGRVRDAGVLDLVERIVHGVEGVGVIANYLVIGS